MTQKTWDAFLKTMNNDPITIVLDLTKKENTEKENLVNKFDSLFYKLGEKDIDIQNICLLYTSPSPRDGLLSRMPSSA